MEEEGNKEEKEEATSGRGKEEEGVKEYEKATK